MTQRDEREKLTDERWPINDHAADMLKAICSAGERCSCADKNGQWYDQNCKIGIAHVNAIARRTPVPGDGEAHAEIQRLQDAKRRALAIADERAKENVALREALKTALRQWKMYADMYARPEEGSFNIADERSAEGDIFRHCTAALSNAPPASEGVREVVAYRWRFEDKNAWDYCKARPAWAGDVDIVCEALYTAPEPTDTPDEGPDPLGYAKEERA